MVFVSSASYAILGLLAVILAVMLYGVYMVKARRRMRSHGLIMATLVALNIIAVAAVMAPTFYSLDPVPGTSPASLMLAHHYLGLTALALTALVTSGWALRGAKNKGCLGTGRWGRLIMRTTFVVWTASLLLGIAVLASDL